MTSPSEVATTTSVGVVDAASSTGSSIELGRSSPAPSSGSSAPGDVSVVGTVDGARSGSMISNSASGMVVTSDSGSVLNVVGVASGVSSASSAAWSPLGQTTMAPTASNNAAAMPAPITLPRRFGTSVAVVAGSGSAAEVDQSNSVGPSSIGIESVAQIESRSSGASSTPLRRRPIIVSSNHTRRRVARRDAACNADQMAPSAAS
ncbi:hypothetical protein YM304_16210 [Ilumatobacter coccineus YM16-304]|uniref:Uncharacterized protein n=1 Tax=Ilumatobacter coccineus (strain NBRC 103263 / KCTC 29153 / YM16-304) TaxID=1313172 RepID=A0A6C7E9W6_ILUCY|nr:hypothetical protein YM304_16210 [Ilumatobacter coccineus YM16-304]